MSDTHLPDGPLDGDDLLAAEYALGVLDAGEMQAAAARIDADAGFAASVTDWQERLAPLIEMAAETAPPPEVWARIETLLGHAVLRPADRRASWWDNVALWRWLTFGAGALAAASIALLVLATTPEPAQPMMATLASDGGAPVFVAMIDESGMLSVMPMAKSDDTTHAHELWIIAKDENPISLGLVPGDGLRRMKMPPAHMERAHKGALLAISLEPQGGSPSGQPTGPVIGAGPIQRL
jgi:anti-sigma-K factor RskA